MERLTPKQLDTDKLTKEKRAMLLKQYWLDKYGSKEAVLKAFGATNIEDFTNV